jgi:hypothetical protein
MAPAVATARRPVGEEKIHFMTSSPGASIVSFSDVGSALSITNHSVDYRNRENRFKIIKLFWAR